MGVEVQQSPFTHDDSKYVTSRVTLYIAFNRMEQNLYVCLQISAAMDVPNGNTGAAQRSFRRGYHAWCR